MRIGIIGAGFTGLAAGLYLVKRGQQVVILEKGKKPGGLAVGFKDNRWKWALERHYHHLFVSDQSIRNLAKEVNHKIFFKKTKTSVFFQSSIYQLDSPASLLKFSPLSLCDRLRVGITLFFLKVSPFWKVLESAAAKDFLLSTMGKKAWEVLWHPLFIGKFGKYAKKIPASWFWARIKKRSTRLGYPAGGFESLAKGVVYSIEEMGGDIIYNTEVSKIKKNKKELVVYTDKGEQISFDKVICTLPTSIFLKITKGLPKTYKKKFSKLFGLGVVNLVLALKKQFLSDGTYWLNMNEEDFPFLTVVEHTNFISPKHYGGDRILYIGNYLPKGNKYFKKNERELSDEFYPYLQKINPDFKKSWVRKSWVFKASFAQPIISLNYSKQIPNIETPIKGLYLANIQQVYPWDRGTNYAVMLGKKAATIVLKENLQAARQ